MYIDVLILNEAQGQAVALTDTGQVQLVGPATLAPHDALTLTSFLERCNWSLQCIAGLAQHSDVIAVWRPSALRLLCEQCRPPSFQALLQKMPGQLIALGQLDEGSPYYYAGLTEEQREAVLVPAHCYFARLQAALVARVVEGLQSDDIWSIAAAIEAGQEAHDSASGSCWPPLELAHAEAREVAYWRREAGERPLPGDTRDARVQLRRYRHPGGGHG